MTTMATEVTPPREQTCQLCVEYIRLRSIVIGPHLQQLADAKDISYLGLLIRYMVGVHDRHLSGKSLSTEPTA